jgi:hypothetical protein
MAMLTDEQIDEVLAAITHMEAHDLLALGFAAVAKFIQVAKPNGSIQQSVKIHAACEQFVKVVRRELEEM